MASHNAVLTQLKGSNFYPLLFNAYPLYLYDTFLLVRCLLITVKLFLLQLSFSLVDLFPLQTMPVIITQAMPLPQEFAHWFGPRKGTINAFFLYLFYPYLVPFVILSALCPTNNSLPPHLLSYICLSLSIQAFHALHLSSLMWLVFHAVLEAEGAI